MVKKTHNLGPNSLFMGSLAVIDYPAKVLRDKSFLKGKKEILGDYYIFSDGFYLSDHS